MSILPAAPLARRRHHCDEPAAAPDPTPPELATAVRSARWLAARLGYPPPHVETIAEHLGRGGAAEDCPCIDPRDLGPIGDLVDRRMGRLAYA